MTKICIYGAGAVGGFLVTKLNDAVLAAPTGTLQLTVVCRPATVAAIRSRGYFELQDSKAGTTQKSEAFKLLATDETEQAGEQDFVISCLKGHQLAGALDSLQQLMGPHTCLICLQNGLPFWHNRGIAHPDLHDRPIACVDPGGALLAAFPAASLAGCVSQIAIEKVGPGVVRLNVAAHVCRFWFGECLPGPSDRLSRLVTILSAAGVTSEVDEKFHNRIWNKLRISASANTTNTLTQGFTDDLMACPAMYQLNSSIVREVMAVGSAIGVTFDSSAEELMVSSRGRFPHSKFSMLQDAEAGQELEVHPYVTALQEVAACVGVPMPVFDTVATLLKHFADNKEKARAARVAEST